MGMIISGGGGFVFRCGFFLEINVKSLVVFKIVKYEKSKDRELAS
jgi:hypothetical protein